MVKKHILIVPGDGIGQEVTAVGKKVLEKIAAKFGHEFTYDEALTLSDKDNDYTVAWDNDTKVKTFFTTLADQEK